MKFVKRRDFCLDVAAVAITGCNTNAAFLATSSRVGGWCLGDLPAMPTIDRVEIPQEDLNIESKVRSNLFAWNGQFSPQFIEALLDKYARSHDFVLDPFLGSGTVLYECARKGLGAYGIELNAAAYHMAKTYELVNASLQERETLIRSVDKIVSAEQDDDRLLDALVVQFHENKNPRVRSTIATLVVLLDVYNNVMTRELLLGKWNSLKGIIKSLPMSEAKIVAEMGDARRLNLQKGMVDLVITSPPYVNVFNYHQKYRRSVELLGYDVLKIAKGEFGSNRKNRGNRFLTVIQYVIDMSLAMQEALRSCKCGARMIYVVGRDSCVLGYHFCNSELMFWIGTEVLGQRCILRQERVFKNRYGQMIYEDILHFKKVNEDVVENEEIENRARQLAVCVLQKHYDEDSTSKNASLLHEAIDKAFSVKRSEM